MKLFKLCSPSRGRPKGDEDIHANADLTRVESETSTIQCATSQRPFDSTYTINVLDGLWAMHRINETQFQAAILFKRLAINVYSNMNGPRLAKLSSQKCCAAPDRDHFGLWKRLLAKLTDN